MPDKVMNYIDNIDSEKPVLIAGPTGSGKSSLALRIARKSGGVIVNADALQVFACWQLLSARPSAADLAAAPHALYGHIDHREIYSTGQWLREVTPYLNGSERPIIVGGTGLNFTALTEGLAEIPPTPPEIRTQAEALPIDRLLADLDCATRDQIDTQNPARIRRAWEVQRATGKSIRDWQAATPEPLLPLAACTPLVLDAPKDWLTPRLAQRFDAMIEQGALDEVRAMRADWDPARPSSKAIGAPELMVHLDGALMLDQAVERAVIASRQYAKRQRTWFRARMRNWQQIAADAI